MKSVVVPARWLDERERLASEATKRRDLAEPQFAYWVGVLRTIESIRTMAVDELCPHCDLGVVGHCACPSADDVAEQLGNLRS